MPNTPLNPDALSDTARVALINSARELGQEHWCLSVPAQAKRVLNECADALATAQPVVTSVEELDALPVGSVVLDRFDYPHHKYAKSMPDFKNLRTGHHISRSEFYLPARVLYRPEVKP